MADTRDAQELSELKAFRPSAGPLMIAVLCNVVLAALCLGVPYYRGKLQAQESLDAFAGFAACMLGGEAQATGGLGLPPGGREQFAANVMRGPDDWPARCGDKLEAIAPDAAIFLWPSVKQAGADLRAVVALLDSELEMLSAQRNAGQRGRVPERPLLALERLRAGLTLMAQATSTDASLDRDVVRFTKGTPLASPARLPLMAGPNAALHVWIGADGLEALAMDRRGISWLRLESGEIDRRRVKRTGLVRATLKADGQPYVLWAMSPERCAEAEDRCARRAIGVAPFSQTAAQLPEPVWLAGHPAGRADRSVHIGLEGRVELLARASAEGSLELHQYQLPSTVVPDARPLRASVRRPLPPDAIAQDALLLTGSGAPVAYATVTGSSIQYWLWGSAEGGAPRLLATDEGTTPWLGHCRSSAGHWLLLGNERATHAAFVPDAADAAATVIAHRLELPVDRPLHEHDPAGDGFRALCRADDLTVVAITQDGALGHLRCSPTGCTQPKPVVADVARFDATSHGAHTAIAYTRTNAPEIAVVRLGSDGRAISPTQTPAPCWDPQRGMCGQPTLTSDGTRLLLSARDGSDLLTIESDDGGEHWHTLSGLKVSAAGSTDVGAPMDQHRIRKGMQRMHE